LFLIYSTSRKKVQKEQEGEEIKERQEVEKAQEIQEREANRRM
jgi:hypothetical protein